MDRAQSVGRLLDDLVAAIEQREIGDPDAGDWLVSTRIRRLERDLVDAYRIAPDLRRSAESTRDEPAEDRAALAGIV